jgi:diguanylate cyclase (GGDEF)-like protein
MMTWLHRQSLVIIVLFGSLGLTLLLWQHEKNNAELDIRITLDFQVRDLTSRIEQRMAAYEQVLRGVQALYSSTTKVPHLDFASYVENLQLGADFTGMEAIGISISLAPEALSQFKRQLKQQGGSEIPIHPQGQRASYAPVLQIVPALGPNVSLLGLNMYADPGLRTALERARDAGVMTISSKLLLPQVKDGLTQTGFVMCLPLYKKNSVSDTPEQRRENLTGWVFAQVKMADMIASLYGENQSAVNVKIYEGVEALPERLMYDSLPLDRHEKNQGGGGHKASEYLMHGGSNWTVVMTSLPGFAEHVSKDKSGMIAAAGALLSVLFAALTWQLLSGRERALRLARAMTRDLRESEARFRYLAQYDELSGLPNRAMFRDRLQHAIVQARRDKTRLALMYLDLDKFKPVNDQLGHHVGDLLLRAVAETMLSCVRESDTVARLGGDEFVILLPLIEQDYDALRVAEKIRYALSQPFQVAGSHVLNVSASIGIAVYPDHGTNEIELSKNADNAMYQAKECGRNQVRMFSQDGALPSVP